MVRDRYMAAPILITGEVHGVVFLQAGDEQPFADDVDVLLGAVASRIATLLHSACLVDRAAQRAENIALLETLGFLLSAGILRPEHLNHSIETAVKATASEAGVLALLGDDGRPLDLYLRGPETGSLRALADAVTAALVPAARFRRPPCRGRHTCWRRCAATSCRPPTATTIRARSGSCSSREASGRTTRTSDRCSGR